MSPSTALLKKDARAQLPAWAGATALVLLGVGDRGNAIEQLAVVGYMLGSLGLGAQAFGHEYTYRTLPMLMTQPIPRWRIYLVKMGVLAVCLTALAGAAWLGVFRDVPQRHLPAELGQVLGTVWLTAFFLAPTFTLLTRNPIAGALFGGSMIGIVALTGGLIGIYRFGLEAAGLIDRFQADFFWRVMPVLWIAGALGGWTTFMRLQAIEGGGTHINPLGWMTRSTAPRVTRAHPVWRLVAKELHLQQLPFAVGGLYVAIAVILLVRQAMDATFAPTLLAPVTFMYGAGLAIVIGAIASAEERQYGTHEWQQLLPMSATRQWLIKAAVVLAVALLLAVALPAAVVALFDRRVAGFFSARDLWMLGVLVALLASASLYVSTLATSGVKALTLAVPFLFAGVWIVEWGYRAVWMVLPWEPGRVFRRILSADEYFALTTVLAVAIMLLLLRLGRDNHRTSDSARTLALRQVPMIATAVLVASVVLHLAGRGW